MPATHISKEKASRYPVLRTEQNAQESAATRLAATASKASRSRPRPPRPTKQREWSIAEKENDGAPAMPVTLRQEVEPRADGTSDEVATLQARLKAIDAEIASTEQARDEVLASLNRANHVEDVVVIEKPFGEAGDRKKGFVLIKVMELDGSVKAREQYKAMLLTLAPLERRQVPLGRIGINKLCSYKKQSHAKLGTLEALIRKRYPYLTSKRFPAYWPIKEMLKQYIKNAKRSAQRRAAQASVSSVLDDAGANGSDTEGGDYLCGDGEDTDLEISARSVAMSSYIS